jgi:hypothetical protein
MGPTAGDILIPSGRCDGTAVAVSVEDLPAGSRIAVRRIGVVLRSCKWIDEARESGQLVEATVVPPANTVASSTAASLRVMVSLLAAVLVAGCLAFAAQVLLQLSATAAPRGDVPKPSHDSCCCTQPGRVISDCGGACSCDESCKLVCSTPLFDAQCYLPYINRSDGYRNVGNAFARPGQTHADGPPSSSVDDFTELCPSSEKFPSTIDDIDYYQTSDVGGERWYRFVGAPGDALPLHPPPEYWCGTAFSGWLSGYNRSRSLSGDGDDFDEEKDTTQWFKDGLPASTQRWLANVTAGLPADAQDVPCEMHGTLYNKCKRCPHGGYAEGGVDDVRRANVCQDYCSELGYCEATDGYATSHERAREAAVDADMVGAEVAPAAKPTYSLHVGQIPVNREDFIYPLYQSEAECETACTADKNCVGFTAHTLNGSTQSFAGNCFLFEAPYAFPLMNFEGADWFQKPGTPQIPAPPPAPAAAVDCRPCKRWIPEVPGYDPTKKLLARTDVRPGPPVDYSKRGRYPTAEEGKVSMTVCFSGGQACFEDSSQTYSSNDACGGPTCWRHQDIQAVRCDGFFLWQLSYVPECLSGYCTTDAAEAAQLQHNVERDWPIPAVVG